MKKIAIVLLLALSLVACQDPPQAAIDSAKAQVTAAETAEAAKYAQTELSAAQEAMRAADAEVAAQAEKFALFRNYEQAQKLYADAQAKADAAAKAAADNKAKAKTEAEAAATAAETAANDAKAAVDTLGGCKRKPKGFDADVEALKGRADGLVAEIGPIKASITSEDFQGATTRANSVKDQATTLVADVTAAKEKIKCN